MALQTATNIKPQGYFIPYRYAHKIKPAAAEICYHHIDMLFHQQKPQFCAAIESAQAQRPHLQAWLKAQPPPHPRFQQSWFARLDAIMAYNMVLDLRPQRIIEVGCGHSTRFLTQALKDADMDAEFHAIDPAPRADLAAIDGITWHADYVQNLAPEFFESLASNDILFIDSSHILVSGSDVDFLLNGVLPRLKTGVVVHIHDIFLPQAYPAHWAWRGYNEQSAVAALLGGGDWRVLWSSAYALETCNVQLQDSGLLDFPLSSETYESSLWVVKLASAGAKSGTS